MTFLTKNQVIELFKDFEIIRFKEIKKDFQGREKIASFRYWLCDRGFSVFCKRHIWRYGTKWYGCNAGFIRRN